MAPSHSRLSTQSSRGSRGPQDVVFLAATQKVRPAVDEILAMLRESIEGLRAAAATGCSTTSDTVVQISRDSLRGVANVLGSCEAVLREFFRSKKRPLSEPLPLAFVLWILKLLYCSFVFVYMPAAGLALSSPASMTFHALIFLILASFARAAGTDPGGVPNNAEWRTPGEPPPGLHECKRGTDEPRWCRREECYKPDRAHHSKVLGRSVLRMDHHCIWLGNTVGFRNHKFFVLFLFYAGIACGYFGWSILELLVHATLPALSSFLLIGTGGLAAILLGILGPFFAFHGWLLFRNSTTVEFMEGHRSRDAAGASEGQAQKVEASGQAAAGSPYDMGWFHNISSVMGDNPLLWLLPVGGPSGDGLTFPRADDERSEREPVVASKDDIAQRSGKGSSDLWASIRPPDSLVPEVTPGKSGFEGEDLAERREVSEPEPEQDVFPTLATSDAAAAGRYAPAGQAVEPGGDAEAGVVAAPSGWGWGSASDFADDLRLGFQSMGEVFARTAAETSDHLCSLGFLGVGQEQKARRNSWHNIARQSVAAAVSPKSQDAKGAQGSAEKKPGGAHAR